MSFNFDVNNVDTEIIAQELRRLESLRSDLLSLSLGRIPSLATHADAPILDPWTVVPNLVHCLSGFVNNHPDFPGEERLHRTTPIVCLDQAGGWARSATRWYRLGERMHD